MIFRQSSFDIERLAEILSRNSSARHYRVGFSGGADSTALLASMSKLRSRLGFSVSALHFNHQLHELSDHWQMHCVSLCEKLGIQLECHRLQIRGKYGKGTEAEARSLRYEYIASNLEKEEIYLTAHHLEDQAETLLLNLMRGSGIDGLAGMPVNRPLGKGLLFRPLLEFPMACLRDYLSRENIDWIEDPSNQDLAFDRNYVRHCILPVLDQRWPGAAGRIARSAAFCRQASETLEIESRELFRANEQHGPVIRTDLLVPGTQRFSLLFRSWLKANEAPSVPLKKLFEFERQLIDASADRQPQLSWDGWVVHSYHGCLWLQERKHSRACPRLSWEKPGPLVIDLDVTGTLELENCPDLPLEKLMVGPPRDGDRIVNLPGEKHRPVKEILRESGIPPWLRKAVPVIRLDGKILAVADLACTPEFTKWQQDQRTRLLWKPADPVLQHVVQNYQQPPG